ncbi:MAG TPA: RDD family protein, partial [Thermodesulfobacteriota bacterium]|nr:RDD family protein [Thermodesulfobacteriota bacterium]
MTFNRLLAKFIDLLLVAALAALPTWVGDAAALTYALIADGLGAGQSAGKRLVGLKVLGAGGAPCTFLESTQRNLPVALALVLLVQRVPFVWPLLWVAGLGLLLLEAVLAATDEEGQRLGDRLGATRVVPAPRV